MNVDPWVVAAGVAASFLVARRLVGGARAPAELVRQHLASGAKIVDVRSPGEFRGGAFPGAVNIPLELLGGRLREIPKDRPVVLYCASGMRSGVALRALKRAGYRNAVNAGALRHMPR